MVNNLYDALQADLNAYPFQDIEHCQRYVRYLLSDAYLGKEGNTCTQRYTRARGISQVQAEIHRMAPRSNYLDSGFAHYEQLLDDVSYVITPELVERKRKRGVSSLDAPSLNTSSTPECASFMEVMDKTLQYYVDQGQMSKEDTSSAIHYSYLILSRYFQNNDRKIFSRKNGTRAYVMSMGRDALISEMKNELGITENIPLDEIIKSYAVRASSSFLSREDDNTLEMGGSSFRM